MSMRGKKCLECNEGTYGETSISDDMDGVLHCNKCNHKVNTFTDEESRNMIHESIKSIKVYSPVCYNDNDVTQIIQQKVQIKFKPGPIDNEVVMSYVPEIWKGARRVECEVRFEKHSNTINIKAVDRIRLQ